MAVGNARLFGLLKDLNITNPSAYNTGLALVRLLSSTVEC